MDAHDERTLLSRLGSCWGCRLTVLAICLPDALQMSGVDPPVQVNSALCTIAYSCCLVPHAVLLGSQRCASHYYHLNFLPSKQ